MMQTCSEKKNTKIWISEIMEIQISKKKVSVCSNEPRKRFVSPYSRVQNQYQNAEPDKETFFEQIWSVVERAVLCKTEFVFEM